LNADRHFEATDTAVTGNAKRTIDVVIGGRSDLATIDGRAPDFAAATHLPRPAE